MVCCTFQVPSSEALLAWPKWQRLRAALLVPLQTVLLPRLQGVPQAAGQVQAPPRQVQQRLGSRARAPAAPDGPGQIPGQGTGVLPFERQGRDRREEGHSTGKIIGHQ